MALSTEEQRKRNRERMARYIANNREAHNARRRAYRAANLEKFRKEGREQMRRYMAENREEYNAGQRQYYADNKEKWQKYTRQYIEKDRDGYNAKQREKYAAHAEKRREYARRYREANREAISERQRLQRAAKRDEINERARGYYAANIETRRAYERERKKQETPSWVDRELMKAIEKSRPIDCHIDHIVPLKGITPEGYRVTGLNVPWNLQYLPIAEHRPKRTRMRDSDFAFAMIPAPVLHPSLGRG
jgi:hypothetical protein